jgi:potassium-transporting ATPase potassium-binding subunit
MVGRTPEYLGKKIQAREVKLVAIGTLYMPVVVLIAAALAIATPAGKESIYDAGPQGFSETVYAYTSQTNNNGSAFAGYTGFLQPNAPGNKGATGVPFADLLGGLCMLLGRFIPLLAALAVAAGSLATKRPAPAGPGTFRTDSPIFLVLLVGVVVVVAALSFLPALALGPIVQGLTNQLF